MSLKITNTVSITTFKPNKSEKTVQNQVEAVKLLEGAAGCKGFQFEGTSYEEPDTSIRCVEWDSPEVSFQPTQLK
jgi:hypothetical protein